MALMRCLTQCLDNPQINISKRVKDMIGHGNNIGRITETAIEQKTKRRCVAVILMQYVDRDVADLQLLARAISRVIIGGTK